MYQQAEKQVSKAIANWPTADVRVVPGVMCQIRCGKDENDPNIEYQINWFSNCSETYIHNHRHTFDSLCIEGEYMESLWEIADANTDAITYKFYRQSGNICGAPTQIPGVLHHVRSRLHFPGNVLHVDIDQYHSILPKFGSDAQVFTFLAKRKHSPTPDMYILSSSPTIDAPSDEIRQATEEEREKMYNKLQNILKTKFQK